MQKINSILIVGKAGSGKDTLAKMLPRLKRFAFGDELRKVVHIAQTNSPEGAAQYITMRTGMIDTQMLPLLQYAATHYTRGKQRDVLQRVGQGFRNIEPNFWINLLKDTMAQRHNPPWIITDCRYENEFDAFEPDISIFLEARSDVRKNRIIARDGDDADVGHLGHISETGIDSFANRCAFTIHNNGQDICKLRDLVIRLMERQGFYY